MSQHLAVLEPRLAEVPGTVSVWFGRPGRVAFAREADAVHPSASTMKVAVLAALYRRVDAGELDLDADVVVHNDFRSAHPPAPTFHCRRDHDSDEQVWQRLGSAAPLRWLAERMIVRSSNLATNLVLDAVGVAAVADAWRVAGARHSIVGRGIEDLDALDAGIVNVVTAADLAGLFGAIVDGRIARPPSCAAMLDTLTAQEFREDLAAGLPPGTRVAHKNGWISGVRHAAGVVFPDDAPAFVLAVCTSTPLAVNEHDDEACQLVVRIASAAWADRHAIA